MNTSNQKHLECIIWMLNNGASLENYIKFMFSNFAKKLILQRFKKLFSQNPHEINYKLLQIK